MEKDKLALVGKRQYVQQIITKLPFVVMQFEEKIRLPKERYLNLHPESKVERDELKTFLEENNIPYKKLGANYSLTIDLNKVDVPEKFTFNTGSIKNFSNSSGQRADTSTIATNRSSETEQPIFATELAKDVSIMIARGIACKLVDKQVLYFNEYHKALGDRALAFLKRARANNDALHPLPIQLPKLTNSKKKDSLLDDLELLKYIFEAKGWLFETKSQKIIFDERVGNNRTWPIVLKTETIAENAVKLLKVFGLNAQFQFHERRAIWLVQRKPEEKKQKQEKMKNTKEASNPVSKLVVNLRKKYGNFKISNDTGRGLLALMPNEAKGLTIEKFEEILSELTDEAQKLLKKMVIFVDYLQKTTF